MAVITTRYGVDWYLEIKFSKKRKYKKYLRIRNIYATMTFV